MSSPKIFFSVQVLDNIDGKSIPNLRPDEHGYYTVPVAVLNTESRNKCWYDTDSIINEITNPTTIFNQMLTQGNLYGEHDHPPITSDVDRIQTIDAGKKCFHIRRVFLSEPEVDGSVLVMCELKPAGPYEQVLEKSLLNPYENTAFSLRSLVKEKFDHIKKSSMRTVVRLVTFDYVLMQGFAKACKRYANIGTEGLIANVELGLENFFTPNGDIIAGLEAFNEDTLMDLFEVNKFTFNKVRDAIYLKGTDSYAETNGVKRSITHSILSTKRW